MHSIYKWNTKNPRETVYFDNLTLSIIPICSFIILHAFENKSAQKNCEKHYFHTNSFRGNSRMIHKVT